MVRYILLLVATLAITGAVAHADSFDQTCLKRVAPSLEFNTVDTNGVPFKGFQSVSWSPTSRINAALVLETYGAKYYYFETCDICADIVICSKKTGLGRILRHQHQLGCPDLPNLPQEEIIYSACPITTQ
jgi:hypothetical protein